MKSLMGLVRPFARLLPEWLPAEHIASLLLVLIVCFLIGVGVHTPLGRATCERIAEALFQRMPGYALFRSLTQRLAGESQGTAWKPALAEIEEALVPAFIIEELDDGRFTVFVPSVPTPLAGAVYILSPDRVHPLNVYQGSLPVGIRFQRSCRCNESRQERETGIVFPNLPHQRSISTYWSQKSASPVSRILQGPRMLHSMRIPSPWFPLRPWRAALTSNEAAPHIGGMFAAVREFIGAPDPDRFPELALALFRFQYEGNAPYRRFCDRRGLTPANVTDWIEIPAVPVSAFKRAELVVSGLPEGSVFVTSGTTEGAGQRGRHHVPDPSIYRAAALAHFARCVLPDGTRPHFLVLAPSLADQPQSSLCQMIEWLAQSFASGTPEYFVAGGEVLAEALARRLRECESPREPALLIGLTYAFIRFIDRCQASDSRFRLPYASRIVDTGGTKGKSRSLSRNGLLRAFWDYFGVPGYYVANEYGMTEMCSQFYDDSIESHFAGRKRERAKIAPPWVRTQVVSPQTLEPVARGERGLLRHFDLANVGSVAALQTEDVGIEVGEGFEVVGRASGAEARGCALLLEQVA
jgi:hypothetical protein